jgi:hypothetical protein
MFLNLKESGQDRTLSPAKETLPIYSSKIMLMDAGLLSYCEFNI